MWSNLVLGVWVFVAPWVLRYPHVMARSVDHAVGLAAVLVSLLAMVVGTPRLRWVHVALGVALILAPILSHYGRSPATLSDIVAGCGLVMFGLVARYPSRGVAT